VQEWLGLTFKNTQELNNIIDAHLPTPVTFQTKQVEVKGELLEVHY
jgi:hypothetical protein